MKIGILGGTFDPPHFGHLAIAREALKKFKLNKVIFMLSAIPPLKKSVSSIKQREKMLELLISRYKKFEISDLEIKRAKKNHKKSYTINTFYEVKKKYPKDKIYWLIGQDSWQEILQGKWKQSNKLIKMVNFVIFNRSNFPKSIYGKGKYSKVQFINFKTEIPVSSTEIRAKIKKGEDVKNYLPKKVLDYIIKNKLYKNEKRLSRN